MASTPLSLFPLQTVLLPGAALGLRIFESRYLDMVRECGRSGEGFGICLILDEESLNGESADGQASDAPSATAAIGTLARIEDFGSSQEGLLTLRVRGSRRFRVLRTRVRDNGLAIADVAWCRQDPDEALRPEHGLLATLLQRILDQVGGEHAAVPATRLDDAAWVGWRLAEFLPLHDTQRQELLQEDDPHARLERLLDHVAAEAQ